MKLRLHPLYKKLLLLAVVIGPFVWLVLTEDGQWRTDTVLLALLGRAELNLAPERLHTGLTTDAIAKRFPDLALGCSAVASPFGDRLCTAQIGTFNGIPSRSLTLFYAGERLAAVKVDYRRPYHDRMLRWLHGRLGPPQASPPGASGAPDAPDAEPTYTWLADQGVVVARAGALGPGEQPAILWLSGTSAAGGAD